MAVNLDRTKGLTGREKAEIKQPEDASSAFSLQPSAFKWTLVALAAAAVLELLLWRTFTRIGVFIPKRGVFQDVYLVLSQFGTIMLNFAVVLAVITLVMALLRLRARGRFGQRAAGPASQGRSRWLTVAVAGTVMVLGLTFMQMALVQNAIVSLCLRLALMVTFTALVADYWLVNRAWPARLFAGLLLAAYLVQITAKLLHDELVVLLNFQGFDSLYLPLLLAGEGAVLLNGVALYLRYGGGGDHPARSLARNWPALLAATLLAAVFIGLTLVTVAESDIVPILGLYALGYTMQLPLALYVIALFFLLYTVFYNLGHLGRGAEQRAAAFGLILIFTGGYLFNISNQYLFAIIGVLLLTRPELVEDWA